MTDGTGIYFSKVEERLRALVERGWRPRVETHLLGRRHMEQRGVGDHPWVEHSERWLIGWLIYMRPGEELLRLGATSRNGGVWATLNECLDEVEAFVNRENERISR